MITIIIIIIYFRRDKVQWQTDFWKLFYWCKQKMNYLINLPVLKKFVVLPYETKV